MSNRKAAKDDKTGKDLVMFIPLDKTTRMRLKAFAARAGITVNEAVLRLIAQGIQKHQERTLS